MMQPSFGALSPRRWRCAFSQCTCGERTTGKTSKAVFQPRVATSMNPRLILSEKPKLPKEQRGQIKQHLDQNDTYISHSRGKALWDCINMSDFFTEMWGCVKFLTHYGHARHSAEPLRHIKDK